jgi:HK97 gp10 family phage protein
MIDMGLNGERQLKQLLKELGPKIEDKVTVSAMKKAAKPIEAAARANAMRLRTRSISRQAKVIYAAFERKARRIQRRGGDVGAFIEKTRAQWYVQAMEGTLQHQLARSIGTRTKRYTAQGVVYVAIGPKWPQGAHGHLVEYGHKPSGWYRRHKKRKFVPAHPFMRPAYEAHKRQALSIAIHEHRAKVEREARKAGRQARASKINA